MIGSRSLTAAALVFAACHSDASGGPAAGPAPTVVQGDLAKKQDPMNLPAAGTAPTPVTASLDAIWDVPLHTLSGSATTLGAHKGKALLVVNVASKCGLTPQYAALEALEDKYKAKGFDVVGFPCNQFGKQEPGSAAEIQEFCSATYGVTFPMMEKVEVNGAGRHAIYKVLTAINDAKGEAGDIQWNFEKFVISADGTKVTRFRPQTTPDDPAVIAAIEASLPKQ
jgi:glutathione peroxidase